MNLNNRMTVSEARKLLGETATNMSDDEIENLITDLEFIAKYALQQARSINEQKTEPN